MAATYRTLAQAQAAYDTVQQQRERAQRNAYIAEQQAVMGVNNYLKQNGYNGGAAETILLRAKSNRPDYSAYDIQLADLAAIIKGFRGAGRGIGGRGGPGQKNGLTGAVYPAYPTAKMPTYTAMPGTNQQYNPALQNRITGRKY